MVFKWKPMSQVGVNAQVAGERIYDLIDKNGGQITPKDVLADARAEDSPLHQEFEWDDSIAAERFREEQASYLIRSLVVVAEDNETTDRAVVSVTSDDHQLYVAVGTAMSDKEYRRQVLERAMSEFMTWESRYERYKELSAIFSAGRRTQARLSAMPVRRSIRLRSRRRAARRIARGKELKKIQAN